MKDSPLVAVLVTADDVDLLSSTLLFTKSFRTGFPSFELNVFDNASACSSEVERRSKDEAKCDYFQRYARRIHHADWINQMFLYAASKGHNPLVILDSDVIFWKNCEHFKFKLPLAGMHVPFMWNEWANCLSYPRLHTSFMWTDPYRVIHDAGKVHPFGAMPMADYRPFEPTRPACVYVHGQRYFYDSCGQLYNAICGEAFTDDHLTHYDHLNSAAFYHYVKFEKQEEFKKIHQVAKEDPTALRGLNFKIKEYYKQMHRRGIAYQAELAQSRGHGKPS